MMHSSSNLEVTEMALSADLLRGYTDTILLCQLAGGDSYGYEINKRVAELSDGAFELKEATLYTAFRRMEGAGLIISYWGNEATGARRRYYAITPTGRDRMHDDLAAWEETQKTLNALLTPRPERNEYSEATEIPMIRTAQSDGRESAAVPVNATAAEVPEIPVMPRVTETKKDHGFPIASIPDLRKGSVGNPVQPGKTEIPVIRTEEETKA